MKKKKGFFQNQQDFFLFKKIWKSLKKEKRLFQNQHNFFLFGEILPQKHPENMKRARRASACRICDYFSGGIVIYPEPAKRNTGQIKRAERHSVHRHETNLSNPLVFFFFGRIFNSEIPRKHETREKGVSVPYMRLFFRGYSYIPWARKTQYRANKACWEAFCASTWNQPVKSPCFFLFRKNFQFRNPPKTWNAREGRQRAVYAIIFQGV